MQRQRSSWRRMIGEAQAPIYPSAYDDALDGQMLYTTMRFSTPVSTRQPSSVTTTTSSMRTPPQPGS